MAFRAPVEAFYSVNDIVKASFSRWHPRLLALLVALSVLMVGCGAWAGPPSEVVEQALDLRLQQTQQEIRAQLSGRSEAAFSGSAIQVNRTDVVTIEGESAYRVEGQYTLKGRYRDRNYRQAKTPFTLYLGRLDDQTWELLEPESRGDGETITWQHIPLGLG